MVEISDSPGGQESIPHSSLELVKVVSCTAASQMSSNPSQEPGFFTNFCRKVETSVKVSSSCNVSGFQKLKLLPGFTAHVRIA